MTNNNNRFQAELNVMTINQLGERILDTIERPKMYPPGHIREIAYRLKKYKFGILVGSSLEDPAHVTAVATIDTPYQLAFWNWEASEGYREEGMAYRDTDIEGTLHGQATLDGNYVKEDEDEDNDD